MNDDTMSAMTGMPSGRKFGKTRRGGGRHKAPKGPEEHHESLNEAMAEGDHVSAKSHALHLAKALHAATKAKMPGAC